MITLTDYWMGRNETHADECTIDIQDNAKFTVDAVNPLLDAFFNDTGIILAVASGWRPKSVNDATSNAAQFSKHITAQAVDIRDTEARDLANWVALNIPKLAECNLYCERFEWTGGEHPWVHFSPCAPKSQKRFYIPSANPPLVARMEIQDEMNC